MLKDADSVSDCAFMKYQTLLMEDAFSLQNALFWIFLCICKPLEIEICLSSKTL